jgi:hypothetical protein
MQLLRATTAKAHSRLLRCPFNSCTWTVTGEPIIPGGVAARSFSDSNCLPNHKASVRIGEQLMIHINSCQYKEFMIGLAFEIIVGNLPGRGLVYCCTASHSKLELHLGRV